MNAHGKDASQAMIGLCNKKLAEVLLKEAGIDLHIPSKKVPEKQLTRLTKLLKDLRVDITGSKDIAQAQVCAGGVDTREIDAASMMSKLIPGLFFAGEVVDIDGICGGYNLQWAWSSGYVAGSHAGEYAHPGKKRTGRNEEIMIRINQIKLPVTHDTVQLEQKIKKALKLKADTPFQYQIVKKSIDARKKPDLFYVYSVDVETSDDQKILKKVNNNNVMSIKVKNTSFRKS